jgi:predicted metal-dependent hydrolase
MNLTIERFRLDGTVIDFDLIRKRSVRRNIHVRFEENGRMRVTAPLRASKKSIHLVLSDMHDQIVELRKQVRKISREVQPIRFRQGSKHLYLGRMYSLDIWRDPKTRPHVILRSKHIEVHVREWGEKAVRDALWQWYRMQAQGYFWQRMCQYGASTKWLRATPFSLKLRRMKRSWGTCSTSGVITLNPLLIKAPSKYVDYVIAHEMCHLLEHNHGPRFYRLLGKMIPNWEALRAALNERSHNYLRW